MDSQRKILKKQIEEYLEDTKEVAFQDIERKTQVGELLVLKTRMIGFLEETSLIGFLEEKQEIENDSDHSQSRQNVAVPD